VGEAENSIDCGNEPSGAKRLRKAFSWMPGKAFDCAGYRIDRACKQ
jgi:hypothetical protein